MGTRRDESVSGDLLERGLDLLRDHPIEVDSIQIAATRSRVLESLERSAARRRRSVGTAIAAIILGTGTLSWAVATGRMDNVMEAVGLAEAVESVTAPSARSRPRRLVATVPETAPETPDPVPETAPGQVPETVTATVPAPSEPGAPAVTRRPLTDRERRERALFRTAHDLHFKQRDTVSALAAWDAYLATAPTGKLAVEARYNRALALVRLGMKAEAIAALAPFARGEVLPAGYRQRPARELLRALGAPIADDDADLDPAVRPDTTGGAP
jgi:hypothetical protein